MVERLLLVALLALLVVAGLSLWRLISSRRLHRLRRQGVAEAVLPGAVWQGPALLYFTTSSCSQCRYRQAPILERLANAARVPIHKIDAVEEDALARHFGIMTVPTTVWLDAQTRPIAINHGLASLETLNHQLGLLQMPETA